MPQALGTRSATRVRVNSAASTVDSSANRQCAISKLFAPPVLLPRDQMAGATGLEPPTPRVTGRRARGPVPSPPPLYHAATKLVARREPESTHLNSRDTMKSYAV